ncbi:MAG: methyltransferase [Burkholderiales bacterium]|nr:methyltransferase [Burkholderiales bacterium]
MSHADVTDVNAVEGVLHYLVPLPRKPFRYAFAPPHGVPVQNMSYEARRLSIRDARRGSPGAALDVEGFQLVQHTSAVTDFNDEDQLRTIYYPEAEALVRAATGAVRVVVFDHTIRRRAAHRPPLDDGRPVDGAREPVGRVHNDYTVDSAPKRVRDLMGDAAADLLTRRFSIVNVWRPIRGPLLDAPLAVCDARSVAFEDFVASDLIFRDRIGETYNVCFSASHRWHYYPAMTTDEALLLKCYDSVVQGIARFAPHTAFDDPTMPADAPLRASIELRTLVFHHH